MRRRYNRKWNAARAGGEGLEQLKQLLAALRAAYLTYRTAHWQASGDAYYGDHLMLQRIYEEAEKHIDSVGERLVGYYGASAVDLADQTELVAEWSERFSRHQDPLKASLDAAKSVSAELERTYKLLKRNQQMTLGMDDLLMSISNDVDTHVYLLQQAQKGRRAAPHRATNPRILRWRLNR